MEPLRDITARARDAWHYLTHRGQQVAVTAAALLLLAVVGIVQVATDDDPHGEHAGASRKPLGTHAGAIEKGSAAAAACPKPAKGRVKRGAKGKKLVALTFDDGPSVFTDPLRKVLRKHGAHATFFVVANAIPERPEAVRAVVMDGNEVGNHSFAHADLRAMGKRARADLRKSNDAIIGAGANKPCVFRPPYGAFDRKLVDRARELGMTTVTWSIDSRDYAIGDPKLIARGVLDEIEPGSIVLMHDAGGQNRDPTVQATDRILSKLRARGYRAVTLSELIRSEVGQTGR